MRKDWSPWRFYYYILRGAAGRLLHPNALRQLAEGAVLNAYDRNYREEANKDFMYKLRPVIWHGKGELRPVIEYKKYLIGHFAEALNSFGVESVLELGSGRGFNLLALACLCPSLRCLRGIELSSAGVKVAKSNLSQPPLEILRRLTDLEDKTILACLQEKDIDFVQGSIRRLPFSDGEFEAAFSNSVIEQIPRDYLPVFREAYRVVTRVGIFSEPFREAQGHNFFKRLYLSNIDYFRASYREVEKAGWGISHFQTLPLQKCFFNTGFLICLKR